MKSQFGSNLLYIKEKNNSWTLARYGCHYFIQLKILLYSFETLRKHNNRQGGVMFLNKNN